MYRITSNIGLFSKINFGLADRLYTVHLYTVSAYYMSVTEVNNRDEVLVT
jgi:hypothetical protein